MAVTLAYEPRYRHITERLKGVHTFGRPMVGGPDLAQACAQAPVPLRDRLLRYIFDRDVVPALPRARSARTPPSAAVPLPQAPRPHRRAPHLRHGRRHVTEGARRSVRPLLRARDEGWTEVTEPGLHYPQMDSLAGLAVVAPPAFLATRLALTRTIPFKYSFDDHGPGHYVNALAPPGVLSEFGDVL